MTWVKLDDKLPEHPKLAGLDIASRWLFIEVLCYCNRQLTDGYITSAQLARLDHAAHARPDGSGRQHGRSNGVSNAAARGAALQAAGLLEAVAGGYLVHDYAVYQPTRAEVLAQLEAGRLRAKRSRERRANGSSVQVNEAPRSGDPVRSVPKGKEVTARTRSPERASARPLGGSRSSAPVPVREVLQGGRLRLAPDTGPPLPDGPPDDLDAPDDTSEP